MRKNQPKGIVHDFLYLLEYKTLLIRANLRGKFQLNLLSRKLLGLDDEEKIDFYKEKKSRFKEKVQQLKGNLNDFNFARGTISEGMDRIALYVKIYPLKKKFLLENRGISHAMITKSDF